MPPPSLSSATVPPLSCLGTPTAVAPARVPLVAPAQSSEAALLECLRAIQAASADTAASLRSLEGVVHGMDGNLQVRGLARGRARGRACRSGLVGGGGASAGAARGCRAAGAARGVCFPRCRSTAGLRVIPRALAFPTLPPLHRPSATSWRAAPAPHHRPPRPRQQQLPEEQQQLAARPLPRSPQRPAAPVCGTLAAWRWRRRRASGWA
jgi:hypothetical protein